MLKVLVTSDHHCVPFRYIAWQAKALAFPAGMAPDSHTSWARRFINRPCHPPYDFAKSAPGPTSWFGPWRGPWQQRGSTLWCRFNASQE